MEDILKKIIQIDNNAKDIVKEEKKKQSNIEEFIENEFQMKKIILDLEYKDEIKKQKEKYEKMFEEKKKQIDNKVENKINNLEIEYKEKENKIISEIINSIKNEEE